MCEKALTTSKRMGAVLGIALASLLAAACTDHGGAVGDDVDAQNIEGACPMALKAAPMADPAWPYTDSMPTATRNTWDGETIPQPSDADYPGGKYRTITPDSSGKIHPGCSVEGLGYTPANIPGYPCAAKQYPYPAGVSEDTSKPIVLLIHGNSDVPASWEGYLHPDPDSLGDWADRNQRDQLAEHLPAQGYRTIAVDMRFDLVDDPPDPGGDPTSPVGNTSKNMDHGWATPITQELLRQVVNNNPGRKVSMIGLSLGATVVRDAIRRLYVDYRTGAWDKNPFEHLADVILASGGHHGVSTYSAYCGSNTTMRGLAACQFGQRNTYSQVEFHRPLNGPPMTTAHGEFGGWYETPCADGDYAFGERNACGGNKVRYTTITMEDNPDGTQQDLFISEHASRVYPPECANNVVNPQSAFDTSGYLLNGMFRNHYGSVRSEAGIAGALDAAGN